MPREGLGRERSWTPSRRQSWKRGTFVPSVHCGLGSTGRTGQTWLEKVECAGIPSHRGGARAKGSGAPVRSSRAREDPPGEATGRPRRERAVCRRPRTVWWTERQGAHGGPVATDRRGGKGGEPRCPIAPERVPRVPGHAVTGRPSPERWAWAPSPRRRGRAGAPRRGSQKRLPEPRSRKSDSSTTSLLVFARCAHKHQTGDGKNSLHGASKQSHQKDA